MNLQELNNRTKVANIHIVYRGNSKTIEYVLAKDIDKTITSEYREYCKMQDNCDSFIAEVVYITDNKIKQDIEDLEIKLAKLNQIKKDL